MQPANLSHFVENKQLKQESQFSPSEKAWLSNTLNLRKAQEIILAREEGLDYEITSENVGDAMRYISMLVQGSRKTPDSSDYGGGDDDGDDRSVMSDDGTYIAESVVMEKESENENLKKAEVATKIQTMARGKTVPDLTKKFQLIQDDIVALEKGIKNDEEIISCLLYTSPSPRDKRQSRMPSSA